MVVKLFLMTHATRAVKQLAARNLHRDICVSGVVVTLPCAHAPALVMRLHGGWLLYVCGVDGCAVGWAYVRGDRAGRG